MNIEAKQFVIEMPHSDLWSTACDVKNELVNTLKTHWVNHQSSWKTNESNRLYRIEKMFTALGRPDMYADIQSKADEIFKDFNDKRSKQ